MDRRRSRHAGRRDELVGRAADYAYATGLSDLSLRPLAEAVGVSHRTLLHHFGTKEGLLAAVLREIRARERLMLAADHDGELVDALCRSWKRLSAPEHEPFFRLYFEVQALALRDPGAYPGFLEEAVAEWVGTLEALFAREGLPPERGHALATLGFATVRGLLLDLLATGDRARVDAAFDAFATGLRTAVEATR